MPGYPLFPLTFFHNTYHFSFFWWVFLFFFFPAEAKCLGYKHKCLVHTVGTQRILWGEWLRYECQVARLVYPEGPEYLALGFKYLGGGGGGGHLVRCCFV